MPPIKLQSSDEQIFEVDLKTARLSSTINGLLENLDITPESEADPEPIPLSNVNAATLKLVLDWAAHHVDDPPPANAEDEDEMLRALDIPQWDVDFLTALEDEVLFDLLEASNYLDVKGLLESCSKFVAKQMIGKTPEEIRARFDIEDDLTQEEKDRIRKDLEWCMEK